jgi:large subunit ribosomal protein L31|tara:strand:+ start:14986 stop:15198 length:213 start_codon:yes stop_codon:yes gene_type:complete
MSKKDIHPDIFSFAQVFYDGELVMLLPSTKERLNVDIWSGIHPFYTGSTKVLDTEGRVERFLKKYKLLED